MPHIPQSDIGAREIGGEPTLDELFELPALTHSRRQTHANHQFVANGAAGVALFGPLSPRSVLRTYACMVDLAAQLAEDLALRLAFTGDATATAVTTATDTLILSNRELVNPTGRWTPSPPGVSPWLPLNIVLPAQTGFLITEVTNNTGFVITLNTYALIDISS